MARLTSVIALGLLPAGFLWGSTPRYESVQSPYDSGRRNVTRQEKSDKEALGGKSLRLCPELKVTAPAADFYIYPPYPGRYQFTWHLKIDDNTGVGTVVACTPGFTDARNPSLSLAPTNFIARGKYQSFVVEGVVPENVYGVYATDFYCETGRTVWWDYNKCELVECFDDARVIREFYPGFRSPADFKRTAASDRPRVHVAYGGQYASSGVREALRLLHRQAPPEDAVPADIRFYKGPPPREPGQWREGSIIDHGQVRERIPGFPDTQEAFAALDMIILANVPGRSVKAPSRVLMADWVRAAGGGLLLTGGMTALGKGYAEGTVLEQMLPVELAGVNDTKAVRNGQLVVKDKTLAALVGTAPLATRFYQLVRVKPGATVLIETRDGAPLLVDWPYGAGRVAVWAAMPIGSPPPQQIAWWKSDKWPAVLAEVIQRTAGK